MGSELSEKILGQVDVHQRSALSLLLFAIVVNVITENAKGLMNKILYADVLVLMSKFERKVFEMFFLLKSA